MTFYGKQREVLTCFLENRLSRLNLLVGAVRSGKTFIALIVWALWVGTSPPGGAYLMCAKSLTTLKRNSLDLLTQLVGSRNFTYSLAAKQGELFGRRVYLEGCNDARAESHIRGLTLQGAYCDELTLFPEDFFAMLLSRLSEPGAKLFATTNPDNPRHWLKVRYMDRAAGLDMRVTEFSIDDNAALDPAYVENLKREYTGVFYKRFILGLWVVADGLCYPQFAHAPGGWLCDRIPEPESVQFLTVGVDFGGNRSLTTFVAAAVHRGFSKIGFIADHHIEGKRVRSTETA